MLEYLVPGWCNYLGKMRRCGLAGRGGRREEGRRKEGLTLRFPKTQAIPSVFSASRLWIKT